MDAIAEVGPGGHYLGCGAHPAHYETRSGRATCWTIGPSRPGPRTARPTPRRWPAMRVETSCWRSTSSRRSTRRRARRWQTTSPAARRRCPTPSAEPQPITRGTSRISAIRATSSSTCLRRAVSRRRRATARRLDPRLRLDQRRYCLLRRRQRLRADETAQVALAVVVAQSETCRADQQARPAQGVQYPQKVSHCVSFHGFAGVTDVDTTIAGVALWAMLACDGFRLIFNSQKQFEIINSS